MADTTVKTKNGLKDLEGQGSKTRKDHEVKLSEIQASIDAQQALLDEFRALKRPNKARSVKFGSDIRNAAQRNYQRGRNINGNGTGNSSFEPYKVIDDLS